MIRPPVNHSFFQHLPLAVLLTLVLLTYSNKVDDLDLWWHLKSGQTVLQGLSLPEKDTFSYTTGNNVRLTEQDLNDAGIIERSSSFKYWGTNLRQSWMGQVLFYLAYAGGGIPGIGLFKALVFVLTFTVLYWAMRRKGAGNLASLLALFLIVIIGRDFDGSRPGIFTFFFLAILFYLFADFKKGGRKIMAMPGVFFIWQNLHGGFVVGAIILLIFWSAEFGKHLLNKRTQILSRFTSDPASVKLITYCTMFSLVLMLANPNHYKIFLVPFAIKTSLFHTIQEYARPMLYEYHAYWFLLALVLFFLVLFIKSTDITDVLLISFLIVVSQMGIRGIPLFAIGAAPFFALSLTSVWFRFSQSSVFKKYCDLALVKRLKVFQPAQILLLLLLLQYGVSSAYGQGFLNFTVDEEAYPGKAVTFLREKNYPGRLFNAYNWGGYLIWSYPERQVFIDGRCLDEEAFLNYKLIMSGAGGKSTATSSGGNQPLWKKLLDEYDIQIILTNAVDYSGKLVSLVDQLIFDPEWALVYQDGTALVYIRDTPLNRNLYGRDYLPKIAGIYDEIIRESQRGLAKHSATWGYYELLGFVYMNRRELAKSREMYEKYLSMNPNNIGVIQQLNLVRGFLGEAPLPVPVKTSSPHAW